MNNIVKLLLALLILVQLCYATIYTDTWAAHIEGGQDFAKALIEKHGFTYISEIMSDVYHLRHSHVVKRSILPSPGRHRLLEQEIQVRWLEQQVAKKRVKRDLTNFNDPKWPRMWYLNRGGGLDMNVKEAWRLGFTGKGIVVSILDDGIEKDHPDLKENYDEDASYDVNGNDKDPQPRYDYTNENRHGTRCAGEVAAEANNNICSVGVAYHASIGGVRMLDGDVTDAVEAKSLSLKPQHIHIYSASWGPDDDGRTVDGPANLAKQAFTGGITVGRNGLGSIFVWASGNGGYDHDSCNCDGYTNSIYTLSISSATESGKIPWYSEACSSTLATTYSSGAAVERQIVTTDLRKSCTEAHTGTSASAPLAAGICALALEANPQLTWRDMQHIVLMTARTANLRADDWVINGVGRNVSHSFGYGLMDAGAMVRVAKNWTNVPEQHKCTIVSSEAKRGLPVKGRLSVRLESDGCRGTNDQVLFLEHVQAIITLQSSRRGEVEIFLKSPSGTKSTLLARRTKDVSTEGFKDWAFMTTHSWGEFSTGTWTLEITNGDSVSLLRSWSVVLYGTATPTHTSYHNPQSENPYQGCQDVARPYYVNDNCYNACPSNYYPANQTVTKATANVSNSSVASVDDNNETVTYETCLPCASNCVNCSGPLVSNCLACYDGYQLNNISAVCETTNVFMAFVTSHFMVTFTLAVSGAALLVFIVVFAVLQFYSRTRRYQGYEPTADAESTASNNNALNGSGGKTVLNGGAAIYKSDLEERENQALLGSESDLEDEVFGFNRKPNRI